MAGPAGKKGVAQSKAKAAATSKSLVAFRAGERSSAAKATGRSNAKRVVSPPKKGPTVGDAAGAVGRFANEVSANVRGALKRSPGLQAPHIEGTLKNMPKGGVMGVVKKSTRR
jgi:hypothetical protein